MGFPSFNNLSVNPNISVERDNPVQTGGVGQTIRRNDDHPHTVQFGLQPPDAWNVAVVQGRGFSSGPSNMNLVPSHFTRGNVSETSSLQAGLPPGISLNDDSVTHFRAYISWQEMGHDNQPEQAFLQDMRKQCQPTARINSFLDEAGRTIDIYQIRPDGNQEGLTVALRSNHDHSHSLQVVTESSLPEKAWKPVWEDSLVAAYQHCYAQWKNAPVHANRLPQEKTEENFVDHILRDCQHPGTVKLVLDNTHLLAAFSFVPYWKKETVEVWWGKDHENTVTALRFIPPGFSAAERAELMKEMRAKANMNPLISAHSKWQQAGHEGKSVQDFLRHIDGCLKEQFPGAYKEPYSLVNLRLDGHDKGLNVGRRLTDGPRRPDRPYEDEKFSINISPVRGQRFDGWFPIPS